MKKRWNFAGGFRSFPLAAGDETERARERVIERILAKTIHKIVHVETLYIYIYI